MTIDTAALDALTEQYRQVTVDLQAKMKAALNDLIASVFAADDKLQWFTWRQYTPYFNDGDPCVFRVYEIDRVGYDGFVGDGDGEAMYAKVDTPETARLRRVLYDESADDYLPRVKRSSNWGATWVDTPERKAAFERYWALRRDLPYAPHVELLKPIDSVLSSTEMRPVLLAAFGDHVEVTARLGEDGRVAFDVAEYEHH